jgi:uncharacterized membrane protein
MTEFGPIEFVLAEFDREAPNAAVVEGIRDLVENGTIRLLDLVLVSRGVDGLVVATEIEDVSDEYGFGSIELEASGIAADEDIQELATAIPPGSSALLAVVELLWAKKLAAALAASDGFVVHTERVPAPVVNAALAALG